MNTAGTVKSAEVPGLQTARTLRVTKQRRQRWLSLAAEAWLRWRLQNGERAVWIAEQVNKQLRRTEPRIRRNSITHNAALIARMAEEFGRGWSKARISRIRRPIALRSGATFLFFLLGRKDSTSA